MNNNFIVKIGDKQIDARCLTVQGMPAVYNPARNYVLPVVKREYTATVNLDRNGILYFKQMSKDLLKKDKALRKGIRLLKMAQRTTEVHKKQYYYHIAELKLTTALGKDMELRFATGGRKYVVAKDFKTQKVRLFKE